MTQRRTAASDRRRTAALRSRTRQLVREALRSREAHRQALATLAHDVRASLAVVAMVLPSIGRGDPADDPRRALAQKAVSRALGVLEDALALDATDEGETTGAATAAALTTQARR